ncbi:XkdQ/YqbQ family protein [Peribacillus loiseleuriae]|uniref:XkdQ/YqbQ family protein n=1 Tax=Peribacillus loiseleuriae TaxID=1679170 RepID=UPI003CFDCD60
MAHELWLLKQTTMTNITPLVGSINWRGNTDELGDQISFTIAVNDHYFPANPCSLGDVVILKNGAYEITRAVIVEETKNGRSPIAYSAFDYAFYLNKSNAVYQFNKLAADKCIRKILADFKIPIGNIASMPTKIDKIFNDEQVSTIINKIIETVEQVQGVKYLMEMRQGKLHIEKQTDLTVKGVFKLYNTGGSYDVTAAISNPSRKRSITNMINSIQVVSNDKVVLKKDDTTMLNKYGRLQKVVTLDENTKLTAAQVAQNELKALSKIVEESSIELIGDDRVRSGRLFVVTEPITGIKGTYLIKDVNHRISGGIHKMSVGLGVR